LRELGIPKLPLDVQDAHQSLHPLLRPALEDDPGGLSLSMDETEGVPLGASDYGINGERKFGDRD